MPIGFDAASNVQFSLSANPSWTHTPVGTPNCVFVTVGWSIAGAAPTCTVTYGGHAMTSLGVVTGTSWLSSGNVGKVETFVLVNPPSGAQTVAVTLSSAAYGRAGASSWTGVDTAAPTGSVTTGTGASGTPSVTLASTTVGRVAYGAIATDYNTSALTAGQTLIFAGWSTTAGIGAGAERADSTGSSMNMNWTLTNVTGRYAAMAFEILPGADGQPAAKRSGGVPYMHKIGGSLSGSGRMAW